jgi:hypothetical protein
MSAVDVSTFFKEGRRIRWASLKESDVFYTTGRIMHIYTKLTTEEEYPALRYKVLCRDSFGSPIFLLVVALDRKPVWRRISPLNHLSFLYTLTSKKGRCMSHLISMHLLGDPRQTAVSDLHKIILCPVAPRTRTRDFFGGWTFVGKKYITGRSEPWFRYLNISREDRSSQSLPWLTIRKQIAIGYEFFVQLRSPVNCGFIH